MGHGYNYIHTCYHSCTVSTNSTSTFQNMDNAAESKGELGNWSEWSGREKRQRKAEGHTGTERHHNNTYWAGEESPFWPHWPRNQGMAVTSGFFYVLPPFLTTLHSVHVKVENSSKFFIQHYFNGCGIADLIASSGLVRLSVHLSANLADSGWVHWFLSLSDRQRVGNKIKRGDMDASLIKATWSRRWHHCIFVGGRTSGKTSSVGTSVKDSVCCGRWHQKASLSAWLNNSRFT